MGLAAAGGVLAARLAAAGATASAEVPAGDGGFEQAFGAHWVDPAGRDAGRTPAVRENWINAYPCCLQTHGAIDAAEQARPAGAATAREIIVAAHPVCLHAASLGPDVADGLQAKFSIPYLAAYTLLRGPPRVESFATVEPDALRLAERVRVRTDPCLLESEALLEVEGEQLGHIEAALGSPARPMDEARLAHKVRQLAGERLDGVLDDRERPAGGVLEAASLC